MCVIVYSTAPGQPPAFTTAFRERYLLLSGGHCPAGRKCGGWFFLQDRYLMGDPVTARVLQEMGPERCGRFIGMAHVPRRALCATRVAEYDGMQTVEVSKELYMACRLREHFRSHASLSAEAYAALTEDADSLSVRFVAPHAHAHAHGEPASINPPQRPQAGPGVALYNRFECLAGLQ